MKFSETKLKGAYFIEIEKLSDGRGFFARSWCRNEFEDRGLDSGFVQANVSYNRKKGTIRGMHYQISPYQECKLIRCTRGAIYDVIIDLRPDSATYKQWTGVELTADNYNYPEPENIVPVSDESRFEEFLPATNKKSDLKHS